MEIFAEDIRPVTELKSKSNQLLKHVQTYIKGKKSRKKISPGRISHHFFKSGDREIRRLS
jgi:hypothetical protein